MKNKKKIGTVLVVLLIALLFGAASLVLVMQLKQEKESASTEERLKPEDLKTFSAWIDEEIYADIPALYTEQSQVGTAEDYGDNDYVLDVNGVTVSDYQKYLLLLEECGFEKHSDNGKDAMEGYVYTASFTRENLTLTVSHVVNLSKTYICAAYDTPLSDHLVYKAEYVANMTQEATTVHLLELNNNGNSFVIQLKNGNFIIHDGGLEDDAPYLLDYLDALTPGDEKPIVEAWFISHAHPDHCGAMIEIIGQQKYLNRLYVDGIYFTEPGGYIVEESDYSGQSIWFVSKSYAAFQTSDGSATKLYRPQLGQRYYFCDIAIDVALTSEQFPEQAYYSGDFNDSSIWLMHHIENQKFLIAGDASHTGMRQAMNMYDASYFDLDVFAVTHHGINVYNYFTDYMTVKTLLYTSWREGSIYENTSVHARESENIHLKESALEAYSYGNGTVVLSFPYTVGTAQTMPPCDWRYNNGKPNRTVFE